jgi:hypothetical protein
LKSGLKSWFCLRFAQAKPTFQTGSQIHVEGNEAIPLLKGGKQ